MSRKKGVSGESSTDVFVRARWKRWEGSAALIDEVSLLEINHINGGGRAMAKTRQNRPLYRDIAKGRVELSEYNVLCRVCNALHYIQSILGVKGHRVTWKPLRVRGRSP